MAGLADVVPQAFVAQSGQNLTQRVLSVDFEGVTATTRGPPPPVADSVSLAPAPGNM
jgi:hypothetical protein